MLENSRKHIELVKNKPTEVDFITSKLGDLYEKLGAIVSKLNSENSQTLSVDGLLFSPEDINEMPEINDIVDEERNNEIQSLIRRIIGLYYNDEVEDVIGGNMRLAFGTLLEVQNGLEKLMVLARREINETLVDYNGNTTFGEDGVTRAADVLEKLEAGYNILEGKLDRAEKYISDTHHLNTSHEAIVKASQELRKSYFLQASNMIESYRKAIEVARALLDDSKSLLEVDKANYERTYTLLNKLMDQDGNSISALEEGLDIDEYCRMAERFRSTVRTITFDTCIIFSEALLIKQGNSISASEKPSIPAE